MAANQIIAFKVGYRNLIGPLACGCMYRCVCVRLYVCIDTAKKTVLLFLLFFSLCLSLVEALSSSELVLTIQSGFCIWLRGSDRS